MSGRLEQALALIHRGCLAPARALCQTILVDDPQNFNALQLLGHIALRDKDYAAACGWLIAARGLNSANAAVHSNLAVALLALKHPREALACCDEALLRIPAFAEAHCNRGHALRALGRPIEALDSYERALAAAAGFADAESGRAQALLELRRFAEAHRACDRVLDQDPRNLDALCLRGSILLRRKHPEAALTAFEQAIALHPDSADAHNNRGAALRDLRRPEEALEAYQRALALRPDFAEVYCNVANIGLDLARYPEALEHCERALRMQPAMLEALNIRGTALRLLKHYVEAAETYEKILAAAPTYGQATSYLLSARANVCDWSGWTHYAASIVEWVRAGESASAPHAFLWICDSPASQLQCARTYSQAQFPAQTPLCQVSGYGHARLRVGYVSADFGDHPVAHLIAGVLERHDRSRFETYGISLSPHPENDAMQARLRNAFEHFHDMSQAGDRDIASWLHAREIDIAVDLTGHTRGGRLGVFAFRPAPVQISYLGYAGTSGADYMDYLIGDDVATPCDQDAFFSERIVRLPHSFLPNDDRQVRAMERPRRAELGLPESAFVFCAFNNSYKLNPSMFDIWMGLLRETPGSVLWLRSSDRVTVGNLCREAEVRHVDRHRLVFAPRVPTMDAHLARYQLADLFLDTWPYGAHATARDALWSGLPVLTYAGDSVAARVASSLLIALGLPQLVTHSLVAYARQALALAQSPQLLADLRAELAAQVTRSPVFDTDLYRRHLEAAYVALSGRQARGEPSGAYEAPGLR